MSDDAREVVLARYGELWLKGKNRREFERALMRNVRAALSALDPEVVVEREHGLLVVHPTRRVGEVALRMQDVFGCSSLSIARAVPSEPEQLASVAREVLSEALDKQAQGRQIRFRVSTKRSDKRFPMTSQELNRFVAERLPAALAARVIVDLDEPELELSLHVRTRTSYVFAERLSGAGGLPVSSVGRVIVLLSGGIDSPVAAWMAMKRGCTAVLLSFHSYPWVGAGFERKVERLAQLLARFQPRTRLVFAPLAEIQVAIRDTAPPPYRTILYRRMMQRVAGRLARAERAGAVVTGESLGQVASQTLPNLSLIEAACDLTVLRPLIGLDKSEIIARAQRIGTFATSIEREPDCCTVFQPEHPVIHGRVTECVAAEAGLDVEGLVTRSFEARRTLEIEA